MPKQIEAPVQRVNSLIRKRGLFMLPGLADRDPFYGPGPGASRFTTFWSLTYIPSASYLGRPAPKLLLLEISVPEVSLKIPQSTPPHGC